jgi:hypothetical protein
LHRGRFFIATEKLGFPLFGRGVPVNLQMKQSDKECIQSILQKSEKMPEGKLKEINNPIQKFIQGAPQFDDMTFLMLKV